MSRNIRRTEYLSGMLYIDVGRAMFLDSAHRKRLPESNFIEEAMSSGSGIVALKKLRWSGEGSGREYELFKHLLTNTTGEAEIICTWDTGEVVGIHVKDGVVTEKTVRMVLE